MIKNTSTITISSSTVNIVAFVTAIKVATDIADISSNVFTRSYFSPHSGGITGVDSNKEMKMTNTTVFVTGAVECKYVR